MAGLLFLSPVPPPPRPLSPSIHAHARAMACASLVRHQCFQAPLTRGRAPLRVRPALSSLLYAPSFPLIGSRDFFSGSSLLPRARCTEQDDHPNIEDVEGRSSESHDDVKNAETVSQDIYSSGKQDDMPSKRSSITTVVLWVSAAVTFGAALGLKDGIGKASEFFAGYILEQSLSVDNLFVFVLVFKYFKVPRKYQSRVLSYGISGAIIFRAIMILLGTATLQRFEAVNLLLASILFYSSYKLLFAEEEETDLADNFIVKTCQKFIPVTAYYDGDRFITIQDGMWKATPLLLTVAVIEFSDIAFAVDSIPAVFGVTRDPLIVFSSNMFAISGLRSLYILISESMSELDYLQSSIGIVLGFIGSKMILDFFGFHVSTEVSLGFVATSLSIGVILSLLKKSD